MQFLWEILFLHISEQRVSISFFPYGLNCERSNYKFIESILNRVVLRKTQLCERLKCIACIKRPTSLMDFARSLAQGKEMEDVSFRLLLRIVV